MALREETINRLTAFSKTDKFNQLRPETKSRLLSFVGNEEENFFKSRIASTEEKISSRKNPTEEFLNVIKDTSDPSQFSKRDLLGPDAGTALGGVKSTIAAAQVLGRNPIAATANPIIELQKEGLSNSQAGPSGLVGAVASPGKSIELFKKMVTSSFKGLTGERLSEGGDVFRNLGAPKPVAAVLGFASEVLIDPTQIRRHILGVTKKSVTGTFNRIGRRIKKNRLVQPKDIVVKSDIVDGQGNVLVAKGTKLVEKGSIKKRAGDKANVIKRGISKRVTEQRRTIDDTIEFITEKSNKAIDDINLKLDADTNLINSISRKQGRRGAREMQQKLPEMISRGNKEYASKLDDISNNLSDIGSEITDHEFSNIIDRSLEELNESFLEDTKAFSILNKLKAKYQPQEIVSDVFNKGKLARPKPLKFNEVVKDFRSARDAMRKTVLEGGDIADADAVASAIWQKNFGDSVAARIPSFRALQRKQGKIIAIHKAANKLFKPKKGEEATGSARKLFEKIAKGNEDPESLTELAKLSKQMKAVGLDPGEFVDNAKRLGFEKARREAVADEAIAGIKKLTKKELAENKQAIRELEDTARAATDIIDNQTIKARTLRDAKKANFLRKTFTKGFQITGGILGYEILRRDLRKILGNND